jgi:hypothetical protein
MQYEFANTVSTIIEYFKSRDLIFHFNTQSISIDIHFGLIIIKQLCNTK